MASLSFSNLLGGSSPSYKSTQQPTSNYQSLQGSPLNSALINKMQTSPYQSLQPAQNNYQSMGQAPAANQTMMPKATPTISNPLSTPKAYASTVQNPSPTPQSSQSQSNVNQQALTGLMDTARGISATLDRMASEEKASKSQPAPQQQAPQPTPLFSQFLNQGQQQLQEAAKVGGEVGEMRKQLALTKQGVMANPNYSGSVKIGQSGIAEQNVGTQIAGLTAQQQALQQSGQAALQGAGIAAPVQVPYSNQFVDPTTGQPIGGGQGVGGTLQSAVSNIAQKVQAGTMGYDDGVAALGAYGQAGINALQQALGPSFDIVASNARAVANASNILQTGTTGGQMQKSAQAANQALDTLQSAYNNLSGFTGGSGVPLINQFTQNVAMATGLGRESVSAYQGALKEARAQINTVLAPLIGVESANATSNSLLPDNMTPGEIPQKIAAAKEYIQQRVDAFTTAQPLGSTGGQVSGNNVFAEEW